MRTRLWVIGFTTAALATVSCEETTTGVKESTFRVEISATSPFVDDGLYLVGDVVQFRGSVTEDGRAIQTSGARFTSSDESIVDILDASTGQAEFVDVGTATVTVTYEQPALQGPEQLAARMNVRVSDYDVALTLTSTFSGAAVSPDEALVGDMVVVGADVTLDGEAVADSGLMVTSSNAAVARPVVGQDTLVEFLSDGTARLTVTLERPEIPGANPLTASLDITVSDLQVVIGAQSLVDQGFMAAGDTLVSDSVVFSATVIEEGDTLQTTGASWVSSDPSIVRIVDAATGQAVFVAPGEAIVSVSFATPDLPGEPFGKRVRVWTYLADVEIESKINPGSLADTLVTDSVTFSASVTYTKDGSSPPGTLLTSESSNPQVVQILAPAAGEAWFPDTGQALITLRLAEPQLPRDTVEASLPLRVTTFIAQIQGLGSAPEMGDTVQYGVQVTDTRDNSTVSGPDVTFSASDPSVIEFLSASTGRALVRDTGQARVRVVVNDPGLPAGVVADSLSPLTIAEERFYGAFSKNFGEFGATPGGDAVSVAATDVHRFTDSTRIEFPNGAIAFIDSLRPDTLVFLVPAGADTGQLVMRNLVDDQGGFRDDVLTRTVFDGPGSDAVDDYYEPNDAFPLSSQVEIALPFEALLAIDPSKTAPPDTNFFYYVIPSGTRMVNVRAEWQQDANLDFFICNGDADPPTGYTSFCARPDSDNSSLKNGIEEDTVSLSAGVHVFAFYCPTTAGACPAFPLTYKVTIEQQ